MRERRVEKTEEAYVNSPWPHKHHGSMCWLPALNSVSVLMTFFELLWLLICLFTSLALAAVSGLRCPEAITVNEKSAMHWKRVICLSNNMVNITLFNTVQNTNVFKMRIYLSNSTLMINIIIATSVSIQVMEAIICKIQRIGEWHYIPIEK